MVLKTVGSRMGAAAVSAAVMACGSTDSAVRTDYDRNLDREVRPRDVRDIPLGTTRKAVERRLGGRGGRQNDPESYPEPKGLDCFYYLELGGVTYYRLCYRRGRLLDKARVVERAPAD